MYGSMYLDFGFMKDPEIPRVDMNRGINTIFRRMLKICFRRRARAQHAKQLFVRAGGRMERRRGVMTTDGQVVGGQTIRSLDNRSTNHRSQSHVDRQTIT